MFTSHIQCTPTHLEQRAEAQEKVGQPFTLKRRQMLLWTHTVLSCMHCQAHALNIKLHKRLQVQSPREIALNTQKHTQIQQTSKKQTYINLFIASDMTEHPVRQKRWYQTDHFWLLISIWDSLSETNQTKPQIPGNSFISQLLQQKASP